MATENGPTYAHLHQIWAGLPRELRRTFTSALPPEIAAGLERHQIESGAAEFIRLEEAHEFLRVASKGWLDAPEIQDLTVAELRRRYEAARRILTEAGHQVPRFTVHLEY